MPLTDRHFLIVSAAPAGGMSRANARPRKGCIRLGFARLGGGSDGVWRGALGIAQRQIQARVAGEGELGRRLPSELRVWSCVVVIDPPASERDAGLGQRGEQRLIQQFIPKPAVEALDEGVLHELARRDVVPATRL